MAFLILLIFSGCESVKDNAKTYTGTVTDKVVKNYQDESKYLIFVDLDTGESVVFENTDSLLAGKFNSSDYYGQIKIGSKYEFKTIGIRIPAFSAYENIIELKQAK
jgi:hypothetical protein